MVTDLFSKWVEAFPLVTTDSVTLAKVLVEEVVCRYGVPQYLHSDQGANLVSEVISHYAHCWEYSVHRPLPIIHKEMNKWRGLIAHWRPCFPRLLLMIIKRIGMITCKMSLLHIELPFTSQLDTYHSLLCLAILLAYLCKLC